LSSPEQASADSKDSSRSDHETTSIGVDIHGTSGHQRRYQEEVVIHTDKNQHTKHNQSFQAKESVESQGRY